MERETKKIILPNSKLEVEIITFLTWGEKEMIQNEMFKGAKLNETGIGNFDASILLEVKYKLFEIAIKEIRSNDGTKFTFNRDWINNLSIEDGDSLYDSIDELNKKKK